MNYRDTKRHSEMRSPALQGWLPKRSRSWLGREGGKGYQKRSVSDGDGGREQGQTGLTPHPLPSPGTHLLPSFSSCCHQGGILVADKGVGMGVGGDRKMDRVRDKQLESQKQRRDRNRERV